MEGNRVGVGVMVLNDKNEVLLGLRRNSHGDGEWCMPGGSVDPDELLEVAARREVAEESGLDIGELQFLCLMDAAYYGKRFRGTGFVCRLPAGAQPCDMEGERIGSWRWFAFDQIPTPLYVYSRDMIVAYQTAQNYFQA